MPGTTFDCTPAPFRLFAHWRTQPVSGGLGDSTRKKATKKTKKRMKATTPLDRVPVSQEECTPPKSTGPRWWCRHTPPSQDKALDLSNTIIHHHKRGEARACDNTRRARLRASMCDEIRFDFAWRCFHTTPLGGRLLARSCHFDVVLLRRTRRQKQLCVTKVGRAERPPPLKHHPRGAEHAAAASR